jgi:predicted metal-dependent hydrolase
VNSAGKPDQESFTLLYGDQKIAYTREYGSVRKTLSITVTPEGQVHVRVPHHATEAAIEAILRRRALWILRQQRHFDMFRPRTPQRRYLAGESHLYLGRRYRLLLYPVVSEQDESVRVHGGYLHLNVLNPTDPARVQQILKAWYRVRANTVLPERFTTLLPAVCGPGHTDPPSLRLRSMTTRWGSFTPSGTILLNPDLIRAPRPCIDYVVLHELCHSRYPNHSQAFYNLLTSVLPDWRERKDRLERTLA